MFLGNIICFVFYDMDSAVRFLASAKNQNSRHDREVCKHDFSSKRKEK